MKRNLWTAGLTAALSAGILFMQPVSAEAGILPEGFLWRGEEDEALDFSGSDGGGGLREAGGVCRIHGEEKISISIDGTSFSSTAGDLGSTGKTRGVNASYWGVFRRKSSGALRADEEASSKEPLFPGCEGFSGR